jgi:hypothetical protein
MPEGATPSRPEQNPEFRFQPFHTPGSRSVKNRVIAAITRSPAARDRLVYGSGASGPRFACGFLQIPPRDGHPCRPANRSPIGPIRDFHPPVNAPCRAHPQKKNPANVPGFVIINIKKSF